MDKYFRVDPEKKVVVAVNKDPIKHAFYDSFSKVSDFTSIVISNILGTRLQKPEGIKGISKCDPRDDFDENIGKRIAELKLEINIHKHLLNQYSTVYDQLEKCLREINDRRRYHVKKIENTEAYLKRMYPCD